MEHQLRGVISWEPWHSPPFLFHVSQDIWNNNISGRHQGCADSQSKYQACCVLYCEYSFHDISMKSACSQEEYNSFCYTATHHHWSEWLLCCQFCLNITTGNSSGLRFGTKRIQARNEVFTPDLIGRFNVFCTIVIVDSEVNYLFLKTLNLLEIGGYPVMEFHIQHYGQRTLFFYRTSETTILV